MSCPVLFPLNLVAISALLLIFPVFNFCKELNEKRKDPPKQIEELIQVPNSPIANVKILDSNTLKIKFKDGNVLTLIGENGLTYYY